MAFVVHTFDQGGLERAVARLCTHLDPQKFSPMVICLDRSGAAAQWIERPGVPIVELGKRPGNDWRLVPRLASALRRARVQLVQSHNWGTLLETVLARRLAGVATHLHAERGTVLGSLDLVGWRRLRRPVMGWAVRRSDGIVTNAHSIAGRVAKIAAPGLVPVTVIPNGVDPPPQQSSDRERIRHSLQIPATAVVVGSVGRLVPVKGFATLIAALAQLRSTEREVHLVLVGDGPLQGELRLQAAALGLSQRVHFVGQQIDIGAWLTAMDVFVNSSQSEGMSQALLEAMSLGLPLVATDVGDSAHVVTDGVAVGSVVAAGEPSALAAAIDNLVCDNERRRLLGERARQKHQERYSLARMIEGHAQLYRALSLTSGKRTA
jgi:glycosyltransferase involved in cell wall biosynthesis